MNSESTRYFAASNSEKGFYSLFGQVFNPESYERIYIIKGGAGTGKSTLMKNIGEAAERRGYSPEYVMCASAPDSLDGVIIPELSAAVIDGTYPHVTDPEFPGAVEINVDLYSALDTRALRERRDEIVSVTSKMKRETATAYKYLGALGEVRREQLETVKAGFDFEKASAAAGRIVKKLSGAGGVRRIFQSAFCSDGHICLDTYYSRAKRKYAVTDKFGTGYEFMARLFAAARKTGLATTVFPLPEMPDFVEALYFEKCGAYFFVCKDEAEAEKCDKTVNIMRFMCKSALSESRAKLRFGDRCAKALSDGAEKCLKNASELHSALERIYGPATDFKRVDRLRTAIENELFT